MRTGRANGLDRVSGYRSTLRVKTLIEGRDGGDVSGQSARWTADKGYAILTRLCIRAFGDLAARLVYLWRVSGPRVHMHTRSAVVVLVAPIIKGIRQNVNNRPNVLNYSA